MSGPAARLARRVAAACGAVAVFLVLALESLRGAASVPDLVLAAPLRTLAPAAAVLAALQARRLEAPARQVWVGRAEMLVGAAALGAGGIGTSAPGAEWSVEARAAAALAFLAGCALLPGGWVLARRGSRELRRPAFAIGPSRAHGGP